MKNSVLNENLPQIAKLLHTGRAVILCEDKEKNNVNAMTIGWGQIGPLWKKDMMSVFVRKSRYTHDLIEKSKRITVSLNEDKLNNFFMFSGRNSGRDVDKIKEHGLTTKITENGCPIIPEFDINIELEVRYEVDMEEDLFLGKEEIEMEYKNGDLHTIYFCDVLNVIIK